MTPQQRLVVYFGISVGLYWFLKLCFARKKTIEQAPNNYFGLASLLWFIASFPLIYEWGNKIPGSAFERSSYSGDYYAILYRDTKQIEAEKVIVNIEADPEIDNYRLRRLTLENGKTISFDDEEDVGLELDKVVNVYNHNQRHGAWDKWGVMLLDIPVKN